MGRREEHLNSKAANLHADRIIFMTWFPVFVCVCLSIGLATADDAGIYVPIVTVHAFWLGFWNAVRFFHGDNDDGVRPTLITLIRT